MVSHNAIGKRIHFFNDQIQSNALPIFFRNESPERLKEVLVDHVEGVDVILLRLHQFLRAVIAFGNGGKHAAQFIRRLLGPRCLGKKT